MERPGNFWTLQVSMGLIEGTFSNIDSCNTAFCIGCRYGNCTSLIPDSVCAEFTPDGVTRSYITNQITLPDSTITSDQLTIFLTLIEEPCRTIVGQFMCLYFFPPCGNHTHFFPPQSICMEDCSMVVGMCSSEVQLLSDFLVLEGLQFAINISELGFFDCSRTDAVVSPLPHCCTTGGHVH